MAFKLTEPCPMCSSQYWCERPCAVAPKGAVTRPAMVASQRVTPVTKRVMPASQERVTQLDQARVVELETEVKQLKRALADQGSKMTLSDAERARRYRKRKAEKRK